MSRFCEVDNISGVYRITCVPEGKAYVRGGKNMWWQFNHNFSHLRARNHHNKSLQEAYDKYGLTAFTCDIIEEVPINKCAEAEFNWIKKFDPSGLYNEVHTPQITRFINYINSKWLVPIGADEAEKDKLRIWWRDDKRQIINMAKECFLLDMPLPKITFVTVMDFMCKELGYEIEVGELRFNVEKHTYRLITAYNPPRSAPDSTPVSTNE